MVSVIRWHLCNSFGNSVIFKNFIFNCDCAGTLWDKSALPLVSIQASKTGVEKVVVTGDLGKW